MNVRRVLRSVVPLLFFVPTLTEVSPAGTPDKNHQVIIDIVVTDESKQPVKGLRDRDFQLFENGKRQSVVFFEEHSVQASQAPSEPFSLPPNTFTNAASYPPDSINVILLDQLNTSIKNQEIALQKVKDFIAKKPLGAAFAIFTLRNDDPFCTTVRNLPWFTLSPLNAETRCSTLGKLLLVQGITQDKVRLLSALNSSSAKPHQTWLRPQIDIWTLTPDPPFYISNILDNFSPYTYYNRPYGYYGTDYYPSTPPEVIDTSMTWLAEIGHFLQNLPGRKSLIWVSDNFDAAPIAQYVEYWFPPKFKGWESVDPTSPTLMTHLAEDRLNLARVALYPVDLTGKTGKIEVKRSCTYRPDNQEPTDSDANVCTSHHFKLNYVSSQLGGATFHGSENVEEALTHAIVDESQYYTLKYSPTNNKFDAKVRNVKVTIQNKTYQLAYRRRY
jgi:VWFA-related protein